MRTRTIILSGSLLALATPLQAKPFKLSMPVDCRIGETCFIQQYADVDPGPGAKDYRCGSAVYDKHKGTDIRIRTLVDAAAGVDVLAAAPGKVLRTRDGVWDKVVASARDRNAIQDVFCGNGLIIDHGSGWETQYCHMRRGSLRVKSGDQVKRGQALGLVGYSGFAQFPHLHISVRKDGEIIDPFTGRATANGCGAKGKASLWDDATRKQLTYRKGRLMSSGFADRPVEPSEILKQLPDERGIASNSPALVAYGWWINLQRGDRILIRLTGPNGKIASQTSKPLTRAKAQYVQFAGKKRPPGGWPAGTYTSAAAVIRGGKALLGQRRKFEMR